jgi:hypothetical protein
MAFAKGRAFVILNRMAESGDSEAKKILSNLNSMSQEDLDSKLSTLFGKGGASKEGDTAPKDEKGGKAPEGKETALKGKKEPKEGKVVANKDFDPNKEGVQSIFGTEEENAKSKDKQVFDTMEEVAKPKEMTSAKEGIKPLEGDTSKKAPKSIEMLKEWADNKWEGQNDAGEIDAMYDEWKKTGTHPDNKTLGSQLSFNDYIKLEAEKFKNDPFNKAFGKRLEEIANEYDKLTGENAPKNTAMDNFKKGMEDRKQEREDVAPTQNTDAFGTSKEVGGGIGGGQKDLLGKKADMADPNRPDIQAEMEQEMEDQLSGTGTDFEDAEGLALAFETVKKRYANDPQRLAALEKLEAKNPNASPAKGSASNPMTSATEGIKPIDDGKPDTKRQTQAKLSQEISGLMNLGDKSGKDAMKELFETKYANDEKMKDALIQLFAEEKVYKSKRTYGTNSFVKYKDAEGLTQNYKENVARLKQELAQKPNDFDTLAELRKVEMQYQKSLKLINK